MIDYNIYIHVPYCMSKCNYCAFFSCANAAPDWDKYADSIISEIDYMAGIVGNISVSTVFWGGGTPSLMPVGIFIKIMSHLNSRFHFNKNCEITLESNPGTLDINKIRDFQSGGVTRLSVGVQSLDDARLKFLGRRHNAAQAIQVLNDAMACKLNVSADFIYGMPNDTVRDIVNLCNQINNLGINHCSMYELTIEPDTPFGKMNLQMPSNADMAEMYNAIDEKLHMPRYEVSNYARPDHVCKHNQNIWDGAPYIGFGRGAAGRPYIGGVWYEQLGDNAKFEPMSDTSRAMEKIITGMRQVRGLKITPDVEKILNMEYVNNNPDLLTKIDCGRIAATKKGMLILDDLLINLVK